ncbi:MAG: hypothetical protein J7J61_05515 [Candidatus Hydrothermae bacterium]|nr:hypothetical protein [Candidatus Hydrothermae bacterium]
MVTYDDVLSSLNSLKRDVLKYLYAEVVNRRYSIFNQTRSKINTILSDINSLISAKVSETALGYLIEQYYLSSANQLGKKAVSFNYSDDTANMTGLDGQSYDNPVFPQIQLTSAEIDELLNSMKNVPAELRKGLCIIRIGAADKSAMPREPDEEDSVYCYYLADAYNPMAHHEVDYSLIFGQDIIFKSYAYQTIDPLLGSLVDFKLLSVEAESLLMGWFWDESVSDYDVKMGVDIKPTVYYCDPADETKVRQTTAMFVLNIYNRLNVNGQIIIQGMEIPLKAQKHYLVLIGSELTGLRGYSVLIEKEWT